MPLLHGTKLGSYQIVAALGAGGMGEVYRAWDTRLERDVAIKILPPHTEADAGARERLIREAQSAARLDHPNICTVFEVGEADGRRFIVMQYVEGHTLAARLTSAEGLAVHEALEIARQIAEALAEAHRRGIVHRDVKPQNVMLRAGASDRSSPQNASLSPVVKVLDFGLAQRIESGDAAVTSASLTVAGMIAGTAAYMSPEQIRGETLDSRSDLFSFGILLHEIVSGRHPFAGSSTADTISAILVREPPSIARDGGPIRSELDRIVHKCLEKDRERRYQSTQDLVVDLHRLKRDSDATSVMTADLDTRRHNLPEQLTSFVGRIRELAEISRLLDSTRLLTLTGAGGCGKTRLALQTATDRLDQYANGAWVVELAPLSDADLVVQTVATALDVREGAGRTLNDALTERLHGQHLLLVLDNCEHLIEACADLAARLLRAAPNLRILTTSREGLGVSGEVVWRVPSLSLPEAAEMPAPDALLDFEAARLFVERASAVEPSFVVTSANAGPMAEVCRQLDGIPLAIELAAARVRVLSVDEINVRLKDRFRLLTGGSRTAVARQRTLAATVDWSYELLSDSERRLLCRLSIFQGGWTLDAAEDACADEAIAREDILDASARLVDKSLVVVEDDAAGGRRYRFLETVRQYARERLNQTEETLTWRDRHLEFFSALARRAAPELTDRHQASWLARLQVDHDNLRAALEWCLLQSDRPARRDQALELAGNLFWFWVKRGYLVEGHQWLTRALAIGAGSPPGLRARVLAGLANTAYFQGDIAGASTYAQQTTALAREAGDRATTSFSLGLQAITAAEKGEIGLAIELAGESQSEAVASGNAFSAGPAAYVLGFLALRSGNYDEASRIWEAGAASVGDPWAVAIFFYSLACLRVVQARFAEARTFAADGIRICLGIADPRGTAWCLESVATMHAIENRPLQAARVWGASERLLEAAAAMLPPTEKWFREQYFQRARQAAGTAEFDAALSEGRAMSTKRAVQMALDEEA